jgi:hypothetical protein
MDLLEVIKKQLDHLPQGPHSPGLGSVLRHIEVAYRHLSRGESQADDSAFTDAIYRTNQAFEGSIKEAYRVLAEKNPASTTPFQIEQYLEDRKVFPSRVLTQFTNYRTQWRNPSTHDYNLDFGATEAFLAIVSVSAFAKLLVDGTEQLYSYLAPAEAMEGILFLYSSKATKYRVDVRRVGAPTSEPSGRIRTLYILRPLTTEG